MVTEHEKEAFTVMKRTLSLLLACALGLSLLPGCSAGPGPLSPSGSFAPPPSEPHGQLVSQAFLPAASPRVEAALADFGLALLQQTRQSKPGSTLISPFSVGMALSMAANGAEGNTLKQFETVLGGGASLDELNAAWAQLSGDYHALGGSTRCSIANSLWKDHNGGIYEEFASKCRGGYGAQIYEADLSDLRIVDDVNAWVSERTGKLIPEIIEEPFPEETACLLVNALYLKNRWSVEFHPNDTHELTFRHAGGSETRTDFLRHFGVTLPYLQGAGAQGAVLPYDDGRLGLFVLLPDLCPDSPGLEEWLNTLDGARLTELLNSRTDTGFLTFAMPRFTAEWRGNLEKILPGLGLEDPFIPGLADFSSMGNSEEGYYLSQVIHAAKLEVNEKGTEAAAATVVAAEAGAAAPVEGITLVLDRPFLYGIVDLQTGVPLFLGTFE